jgi:hypothetical protein
MPTLATHHKAALVAAVLTCAIALSDAATAATTGHYSVFSEDSDNLPAHIVVSVVHGLCYAGLAGVLARERDRFAGYGRLVRATRKVLLVSLVTLGAGFLSVAPVLELARVSLDGPAGTAWGAIASVAFFGMIGSSALLSVAALRTNRLGVGGRVLGLLLPVAAGTAALGLLGSSWAHPGYVETVINLGIALVGVGLPVAVGVRQDPLELAG